MKTKRRADPLFITLVVLISLILFTSTLMGGLYARYVSHGGAGDSARVAKFDIVESGQDFQQAFAIGVDPQVEDAEAATVVVKDGAVVLTNRSEVAVKCTFSTESTENLPLLYSWACDELDAQVDAVNQTVSFALPPNDTAKTFDLTAKWDVSQEENRAFTYNRQVDGVILKIRCEQID